MINIMLINIIMLILTIRIILEDASWLKPCTSQNISGRMPTHSLSATEQTTDKAIKNTWSSHAKNDMDKAIKIINGGVKNTDKDNVTIR